MLKHVDDNKLIAKYNSMKINSITCNNENI